MSEIQVAPGDWVLFRTEGSYDRVGVEMKQAMSVTPKMVKFDGGYPRQCSRIGVVAAFVDKADAERARDGIAGVAGEFARRCRTAEDVKSAAIITALAATNRQIEKLLSAPARKGE